jgi:uncharacterized protein (TIGR02099 family)
MDHSNALPSKPLVWAARCLKALLWLAVSGWVLFGATLGVVHGIIVPRIGNWRADLETLATKAVGIPVRIGEIRAHSKGLIPLFELSDVRLLDKSGREALQLGRVLTSVSVPSLWRLGFDQIYIDQPSLDVRRRADGHIEVAGLDLLADTPSDDAPSAVMDWFFAQSEFAIRSGTVRWTDDLKQQSTVTLEQVDLVVRNPGRQHLIRLDATPEGGLAGRITMQGVFRSPFLTLHPGKWADWRGTAYVNMPAVDLAKMASPTHLTDQLGLQVTHGRGALRLWLDLNRGQLTGSTADLALTDVNAQFRQTAQPMQLAHFNGRVSLAHKPDGWAVETERLTFETARGTRWTQGNLRALYQPTQAPQQSPGELAISHIDLAALQELASALPLPASMQHWVAELQPTGEIETLVLKWVGNDQAWSSYSAKGKAQGLSLQAETPPALPTPGTPSAGHAPRPGRPGFAGANAVFEMDQHGGKATLGMRTGALDFPGVFEEPRIPMDTATADVAWTLKQDDIQVKFSNVRFSNPDLQGQASGSWRTTDAATSASGSRFPGVLKLDGTVSRGKGERVHRYLPMVISADARHYVRDAILAGDARDVKFKVNGDLWHMPFDRMPDSDFRIVAKVSKVDYAFVPPAYMEASALKWPALRQLEGELVFDRASMSLKVSKGLVADAAGLRVARATARIADLSHNAVVEVDAHIDGPLNDALGVVRRSPLSDMTARALSQARGSGAATIQFGLVIPLARMGNTSVKGNVALPGNDIQISPDTPLLARTKGNVEFSDKGFQVPAATARLVGGELQFAGGMRAGESQIRFKGNGTATADGLRQAGFLGPASQLAYKASGNTAYTAQLQFGAAGPDIQVQSNLQGLQLDLPAPLNKAGGASWPLRYSSRAVPPANPSAPLLEELTLDLADGQAPLLHLALLRDTSASPARSTQGLIAVGDAAKTPPPMPPAGVSAVVHLPRIDTDEWDAALTSPAAGTGGGPDLASALTADLPERLSVFTPLLISNGRAVHDLRLQATRKGPRWQGQLQAREAAGQFDYLPATGKQGAQLQARLSHVKWQTGSDTSTVGTPVLPGTSTTLARQPQSVPALDIEVAALELDGRDLGALSLQATHKLNAADVREWHLTRLNLKVPEAQLSGTGDWLPTAAPTRAEATPARRTALNFVLDVHDSGALLARFGMPQVFKGGKGQLKGQVGWNGAPYALHTPSLSGQINLNLAAGQFLKADPGLAKLLGVLSLQSLPRRLTLDFSDVFSQGFAFDFVRGDARINQGVATTNNLQMKGPTAAVLMEGTADIGKETQDIRALVIPELNAGTASLIATVINPAVGLGTFLAQAFLRQPLIKASTQAFHIHGNWSDPQVDSVKPSPDIAATTGPANPLDPPASPDAGTPASKP